MNALLLNIASYKYEIGDYLVKDKNFENVYITYLPGIYEEKDDLMDSNHIKYVEIEEMMRGKIDIEAESKLRPLGKVFLEKALEYRSTFITLDSYRFAYPIASIDECERNYLYYLKYWNEFFLQNNIEFIMFDDTPHWPIMYSAYAVARILQKKICILSPVGIHEPGSQSGMHIYGESIDTVGCSVKDEYERLCEQVDTSYELEGVVKKYFENSIKKVSEATLSDAKRKEITKQVKVEKFNAPKGNHPYFVASFHNLKFLMSALIKYKSIDRYKNNKYGYKEIRDLKRLSLYYKYDLVSLKEYDKKAQYPNKSDKYIFYPLQLWPEATTKPQSGVFGEQYNAIQLLSYVLKDYDIKIYVKEYYLQPYREKLFWKELERLGNIVYIKSDVTSGELMENALAVANQTGTCLIEAPFYGKPAITFGDGFCLKGMPGLFEIQDACQGKQVIEKILDGVTINMYDLKRYYYAIQKKAVFFNRTSLWEVDKTSELSKKTISELKELLNDIL
ncbi:MAG: hypothetical protein IJR29_09220 [Butyrivibrio sp.]|nr:hypothetical protein [Butyrivibrio sp.]